MVGLGFPKSRFWAFSKNGLKKAKAGCLHRSVYSSQPSASAIGISAVSGLPDGMRERARIPRCIIAAGFVFAGLLFVKKLRVGVDFGYGYTGLAVLAPGGGARFRVIRHRTDISAKLLQRRENRSARRRNKTRIARLRNFRALLAGIGLPPKNINGGKPDKTEMASAGNKLYALAHRRGWDYSTLTELLIDDDGKATAIVREIDELLVKEYGAPSIRKTRRTKSGVRSYRVLHNNGEDQTCLGELAKLRRQAGAIARDINRLEAKKQKPQTAKQANDLDDALAAAENQLAQAESGYAGLAALLADADKEKIESYLHRRFDICGIAKSKRKNAIKEIIVRLGLDIGESLHKDGRLYAPHRNRHRDEFVRELRAELARVLKDNPQAKRKIAANAKKRGISAAAAKTLWINNAVAVMDPNNPQRKKNKGKRRRNRDIRPPRFENRRIGKCPAKITEGEKRACGRVSDKLAQADGERCWCNLPKKSNPDIRRLMFEAEVRQMNIQGIDGARKITGAEVAALMACVDWQQQPKPAIDNNKWRAFFAKHKLPSKEDARGKRDTLREIATGAQGGRALLCRAHLRAKLQLIKDAKGETESQNKQWRQKWQNLHEERRLNIYDNDGAPSVRQKVQKVIGVLRAMIQESGYDRKDGKRPPIAHIGIETARFDISALAQNEGKPVKNARQYQNKSGRDLAVLCRQQDDRCLYCGGRMGIEAAADNFVAKARRGGDAQLNRVAAHRVCAINKNKGLTQPNAEVLRIMTAKGGEAKQKAEYIRKEMTSGDAAQGDSLAGAQHTMIGAKLLKGSLMSAFDIRPQDAAKIFPPVKPAEVAGLRRAWFPLMDRQKRALRAAEDKKADDMLRVVIGAELPPPVILKWEEQYDDDGELESQIPPAMARRLSVAHAPDDKGRRITTIATKGKFVEGRDEGVYALRFYAPGGGGIRTARLVVCPPSRQLNNKSKKDAPINTFHHAVDALACAAFDANAGAKMPPVRLPKINTGGKDQYTAPPERDFLITDKGSKSGARRAKTGREALNCKTKGEVRQRKALFAIAEKNVNNIVSPRMRKLMRAAFDNIGKMPEEKRKAFLQEGCITREYFMQLTKRNALHPTKARAALCKVRATMPEMWAVADKKGEAGGKKGVRHYFKREVVWQKAVLYELADGDKNPKRHLLMTPDAFYRNKANAALFGALPKGAKVIGRFCRGDTVAVVGMRGRWKITEMHKLRAVLSPQDKAARAECGDKTAMDKSYNLLKPRQ